jgi:ribonuclease P protein component
MSPKQTLPASSRLKRNRDFVRVRKRGKPYRCPYFILFALPETGDLPARIGISASKRVGNAVARNRAKRQYRELFRTNRHQLRVGSDLLLSIRKPSTTASFQELEHRFLQAMKYLRVIRPKP